MAFFKEAIDQAAHIAVGWQMGFSVRNIRDMTREEKVEFVMKWVREREDKQHPDKKRGPDGFYGPGSKRDEECFRWGAERGVG